MIGLCFLSLLLVVETIVIGKDFEIQDISASLSYYEDVNCVLEFSEELHAKDFIESDGLLNFNVSKSCFWIKIEIDNQSDKERYQLNLEHAILDLVEFYDKRGLVERISERQPFL